MNRPFALRDLGPTDARWVSVLHRDAFPGAGWPADEFAGLLGLPGYFGISAVVRAADARESPAGFVLATRAADECEVITLAVADWARRTGIARALMEATLARARTTGAVTVHLEVAAANAAALALYRGLAFVPVGRRPGYYTRPDGGLEDAIRMVKDMATLGASLQPCPSKS